MTVDLGKFKRLHFAETLGKIEDKIKPPGVETWSVERQKIPGDAPVRMNPVPGREFAVNVLPIIGGIMNYPVVFSQQQPNVPTIVPSGNLSRTRGDRLRS